MITTAADDEQGGVGMVVRYQPQVWSLESTRFYGPNVVSCDVITDRKQNLLIGAYLTTSTLGHLPDL